MTLRLRPLEDAADAAGLEAAWDGFVQAHPEGSFFHRAAWRRVIASAFGHATHYVAAERDGAIVGVLPLARVRTMLFGDSLISVPFCVNHGPLAADREAFQALVAHAESVMRGAGVPVLEFRFLHAPPEGWLDAADWPVKSDLYVIFRKPITGDAEANRNAIPRKQRAMVRKGISAGLVSREEAALGNFFHIYATSVRNLGTPVFPRRYFDTLFETFRERCRVTTVYAGDAAVSSVLSFVYKDTVMPYYGGGLPEARDLKAYDFMYWEVMRTACEQGLRHFDYGRSKRDSGSYAFKKNWGFEPTPLHYQYHLVKQQGLPDRNPNNPKYELAVNAWKRLPLPLANFLGPFVSPYLA